MLRLYKEWHQLQVWIKGFYTRVQLIVTLIQGTSDLYPYFAYDPPTLSDTLTFVLHQGYCYILKVTNLCIPSEGCYHHTPASYIL